MNSAGQTLTLGTAITVSGAFNHTNGVLVFNGNTISLTGTAVFPASAANGSITGSATSNFSVTATALSNSVYFTTGAQTLRNLTLNFTSSQIFSLGTNLTVGGTYFQTNGIVSLGSNTLTLNAASTFPVAVTNGSITGSKTSSLVIGGAGAITNSLWMTQSGLSNYLNNFTLNRAGRAVTFGNALNLVGTLTPTSGTVTTGGNLTLIADQSGTGQVGRIGTIGATGKIPGIATIQTWVDPPSNATDWRLLGLSGNQSTTFSSWDDNAFITCASCPDGYNVGGTNFGSIQTYAENAGPGLLQGDAAHYSEIPSIGTALTAGKGYWVYLGSTSPGTTSPGTLLDVTGSMVTTTNTITLTFGGGTTSEYGWNLIANPLPSPISWASLYATKTGSVDATIYVYSPNYGDLVTYNTTTGISNPSSGSYKMGDVIPMGIGFYVHATSAGKLLASEAVKTSGNQILLKQSGQQIQSTSPNFSILASGFNMTNEAAFLFDPNATTGYDPNYDAIDLPPAVYGWLQISSSSAGKDYSVNGLPDLTQNYSIPVKMTTATTGTYSITALNLQNMPGGACVILHDKYTNTDYDLKNGTFNITLNDTETVARFVLNITINNNLTITSSTSNPTCNSSLNGIIIATASGSGPWNYYWKDANNNVIKTSLNRSTSDTLQNINGGNYSVDANTVGTCDNGTKAFTLQGTATSNSSFTPSATSVIFIQDTVSVSFTNTSSNASSYWWDFGDGNGTTVTNPINYFGSPGIYTVTLTAYNAACGDSTVSYQIINVIDSTMTAGIAAILAPSNTMSINKDERGYYVQFDFTTKTNAVISVQNLLGEKVTADLSERNISSEKVYISLANTENKILILSVTTESGNKVYRKIINY